MGNWIEINLPWIFHSGSDYYPERPNLDQEAKDRFDTLSEKFNSMNTYALSTCLVRYDEVFRDFMVSKDCDDDSIEEIWDKMLRLYPDDDKIKDAIEYKKFCLEYHEWQDTHPKMVEHHRKVKELSDQLNQKSFVGRRLARPGTLVEIEVDPTTGYCKQYLIGHIGECGYGEGDEMLFNQHSIVKRYKVIWKKE